MIVRACAQRQHRTTAVTHDAMSRRAKERTLDGATAGNAEDDEISVARSRAGENLVPGCAGQYDSRDRGRRWHTGDECREIILRTRFETAQHAGRRPLEIRTRKRPVHDVQDHERATVSPRDVRGNAKRVGR